MRIVLSGGGTAGHINPALALAEELCARGHEVFYAGCPQGVEARLVPEAGLAFKAFDAAGFDRARPLTLFRGVFKILRSSIEAKKWFADIKPSVVVAFGGYVCIPVARAAEKCGVPVVIHEQNSVMGMANKYLAKRATSVCLTYEHAAKDLSEKDRAKVQLVGNPVRREVFSATREEGRSAFGIPDDAFMLLITGGSLGAQHLNTAIAALKEKLLAKEELYLVQITGPKEFDRVQALLSLNEEQKKRWQLFAYTNQMGLAMAAADAIVSRAGASSLAEIAARHLPALLVPFPYATEDHQRINASSCVSAGAALMVADADLEEAVFEQTLFHIVDDALLREAMRVAWNSFHANDSAGLLADCVVCAGKSANNTSVGPEKR